jgi:hypothetical protein
MGMDVSGGTRIGFRIVVVVCADTHSIASNMVTMMINVLQA